MHRRRWPKGLFKGLGAFLSPQERAADLFAEIEAEFGRDAALAIWKRATASPRGRRPSDRGYDLYIGFEARLARERAADPNVRPETIMRAIARRAQAEAPGRYGNSEQAIMETLRRWRKKLGTAPGLI